MEDTIPRLPLFYLRGIARPAPVQLKAIRRRRQRRGRPIARPKPIHHHAAIVMTSHRKHRHPSEAFLTSAAWIRLSSLLLLSLVFWGSLVGCGGQGDTGRSDSRTPLVGTDSSYTPPRQQRETLYAHGEVNVRSSPGSTHAVARTLARGDRVEVGEADARGWSPAYDDHGQRIGYVYRASTNLRPYEPAAPSGSAPRAVRGSPGGATAICRDGTRSYSAHRSGACSRHGGVARWL